MKILIFLIIFLISVSSLCVNSYAQSPAQNSTPKIFLQIQLYDKSGHLYGYIQPRITLFDMDKTISWVKSHAIKSDVVIDGQHYTKMTYVDHYTGSPPRTVGYYFLWGTVNGQKEMILRAWHDSVMTNAGDTANVYWEVLDPLK